MDHFQLSDAALIIQFRQTDPNDGTHKLLAVLYQRHQQSVVRKCYYYLRDWEAAQDVSQEVWIRVLAKLHQFHTGADFTPWLFGIVHNRCRDHIRQDKRLLDQEISRKIADSLAEDLNTEGLDQPLSEILVELMEKISGEEKLLLSLKHEQGWTSKAIAQSLGISEDNVKKRVSRARQKLRKLLDQYQQN